MSPYLPSFTILKRREEEESSKHKLTWYSSLGLSPFLTGKLIEKLREEDKKERIS